MGRLAGPAGVEGDHAGGHPQGAEGPGLLGSAHEGQAPVERHGHAAGDPDPVLGHGGDGVGEARGHLGGGGQRSERHDGRFRCDGGEQEAAGVAAALHGGGDGVNDEAGIEVADGNDGLDEERAEEIGDRQRRLRADGRVREQHEHGERREGDAHERQLAAEVLTPGARGARRAVALVEKAQAEVENRQLEGNEVLENPPTDGRGGEKALGAAGGDEGAEGDEEGRGGFHVVRPDVLGAAGAVAVHLAFGDVGRLSRAASHKCCRVFRAAVRGGGRCAFELRRCRARYVGEVAHGFTVARGHHDEGGARASVSPMMTSRGRACECRRRLADGRAR